MIKEKSSTVKTYDQYISDARSDATDEHYESDMLYDAAESMLYDPVFKRLAVDRYPDVLVNELKFVVAEDIAG